MRRTAMQEPQAGWVYVWPPADPEPPIWWQVLLRRTWTLCPWWQLRPMWRFPCWARTAFRRWTLREWPCPSQSTVISSRTWKSWQARWGGLLTLLRAGGPARFWWILPRMWLPRSANTLLWRQARRSAGPPPALRSSWRRRRSTSERQRGPTSMWAAEPSLRMPFRRWPVWRNL